MSLWPLAPSHPAGWRAVRGCGRTMRESFWRMTVRRLSIFALLAVLAVPVQAADRYRIDTEYSNIHFTVPYDFMILGQLRGEFGDFDGEILYDAEEPSNSAVVVEIVTSSVDTRFEARDIGLKSDTYLAVETFPLVRFEGRAFERQGRQWILTGELTMRGISHEVEVEFELLDLGETLVAHGSSVVSREAFDVQGPVLSGDIVIGDEVLIELHLVLRRDESADGEGNG